MLEKTDKIIYRKIKLLKLLDMAIDDMAIDDICTIMGLSKKTIQKELTELKEDLAVLKYKVKISKRKSHYKLEKEHTCNMDTVYLSIKKKSTYFFLMRKTLIGNRIAVNNEIMYVYSPSKKHKDKKNFNLYLMKYNLELEPRSIEITGNETDIRFLYFQFFWNNYHGVEWPFDTINRHDLIQDIETCEDQFVSNMSEMEKECLLYWLAIIKIRREKNKFLVESQVELAGVSFEDSRIFEEILSTIVGGKEKKMIHVEAKYLYYYFALTTENSINSQQLITALEKKKELGIHTMVLDLIVEFKEKFIVCDSENYETVYFPLYKLYLLEIHFKGQIRDEGWGNIPDAVTSVYYENEFKLFYQDVMGKYGREIEKNNYLYERSLLIFSFFVDQKKYRPKIKMKIFSSGGKILELFLEQKFKKIVSNLEIENRNAKNVDIIVSDYSITSNTKEEIFYWSVQPTKKEWKGLLDTLMKIERNKTIGVDLVKMNLD